MPWTSQPQGSTWKNPEPPTRLIPDARHWTPGRVRHHNCSVTHRERKHTILQAVLTPETRQQPSLKAHFLHMLDNNSLPRRKSGKLLASCFLHTAPSCRAGGETCKPDRHRWKETSADTAGAEPSALNVRACDLDYAASGDSVLG
ncbi:hypothetical protein NDU88_003415 [Pleurodeles waltl]|uniref:Uncharacterized protein n=1 Tax=Pleurodeles waltl TaxID=8319 RepID=A0AAV7NKL0_PLEWA|nr:hypothetical protein NDU88_003415 [Pleurodeles waltl]